MMRVAVLASCAALLCAGAAHADLHALPTNVELALASSDLLAVGGLAGVSTHEDVLVRRLEAMASTRSDAELREQAKVLFKLYKALNARAVAAMGATESEQFEVFYKTVFQQILARVDASRATTAPSSGTTPSTGTGSTPSTGTGSTPSTGTGTTPSTGTGATPSTGTGTTPSTGTGTTPSTGSGTTPSTGSSQAATDPKWTDVAEGLSFFTQVYDKDLAKNVRALQDNTQNIEAIVQSTKTTDGSDPAAQFQAPTVLEPVDNGPTSLGRRRLENSTSSNVDVLFCDVTGNAVWKWSAAPAAADDVQTIRTETKTTEYPKLCAATKVEVKVTAYQSGCSRQNHPEGCEKVYWKGCGGLTVNRASNRIVVARTGGRSLGLLYYKGSADTCQGRVVDAIKTYKGKKFNSISYAEYAPSGNLYFTDSPFGLATGPEDFEGDILDKSPLRELPFNGVFLLKNNSMKVDLVDCAMDRPNKIAFSPKGDVMYITNTRKGNSYVKQFVLKDDGSVKSSKTFFNFSANPELETSEGTADGIKTDKDGNIYVAVHKGVYILSPSGDLVGRLQSNQAVSGIAIGGGRMFLSGGFGVVAQTSGLSPSLPLPSAKTECS